METFDKEVATAGQPQNPVLANMVDILEQERRRISADIHDNVQNKLRQSFEDFSLVEYLL